MGHNLGSPLRASDLNALVDECLTHVRQQNQSNNVQLKASTFPNALYLGFASESDAHVAAAFLNGRRGLDAYYLDRCVTLGFHRYVTGRTSSSAGAQNRSGGGDEAELVDETGSRRFKTSNVECELLVANRQLK